MLTGAHLSQGQIDALASSDNAALTRLVQDDLRFSEQVLLSDPRFAEDAAHEPFGPGWMRRFGKSLLSNLCDKSSDKALEWALSVSALGVAQAIVDKFGVDALSYPAATALALLVVRAAALELGGRQDDNSDPE